MPAPDDGNFVYDRPDSIMMLGRSIDLLFRGKKFDFILVDVEGGQFDAFSGAANLLRSCSILVVDFTLNHPRVADMSLDDYTRIQIEMDFDQVKVPRLGSRGIPTNCLVETQNQIFLTGDYKDRLIFTRREHSLGKF